MTRQHDALTEAKRALDAGDLSHAETLIEGLTAPEALAMRARIDCERGEHFGAIKRLRAACSEQESVDLLYRMGTCWQHLCEWESSEKVLRRAVARDPKHTDAFILLGMALYQQGRLPESVRVFEQALVNDPKAVLARYYLAQVCIEQGNFKRALALLHVLQGLKPDYAPTRRLQATLFLKLSDFRQALVELCWLVEAGEADAWCFSSMGTAYRAIGDKLQALKAFEFALRLDPELLEEAACAAQLCEELEQYEVALALYQPLCRDLQWGMRAQAAVERLERRLSVIKLSAKPTKRLPDFGGFQAPPVNQAQGTYPLGSAARTRTEPLAMREVEYEGPEPLIARLKRNLNDLSAGRLDLDHLRERSQEVLERIPLEALKDKLPEVIRKKIPLDRFFKD